MVISLAASLSTGTALAEGSEPSVDDIRVAGDEFNLGRTAFKDEDYATAAEHFEKADGLAPNPKVLLLAIQSRQEAGHAARAATLAALAQDRYPDEEMFTDTRSLIVDALRSMGKLKVTCDEPCTLLIDSRLVHGAPSTKRYLFLDTGSYRIKAAFEDGEASSQDYTASAGGSGKLHFEKPTDSGAAALGESEWGDDSQDDDGLPQPKVSYEPLDSGSEATKDEYTTSSGRDGLSPAVFWVGAGLTVAVAGVATWSGVDAQSNPGPDKVRQDCVGQGTSCPAYQAGKDAELRTNVLWGVAAGLGLTTILIGSIWTDWGSPSIGMETSDRSHQQASIEPWLGLGDGATVGARGRF